MPSLEAAIFSTIGLVPQLPQEKWPDGLSQQNITNNTRRKYFRFYTYLVRRSNLNNKGMRSDLAAITQIHSICEEVFPLMPAWKLPSS